MHSSCSPFHLLCIYCLPGKFLPWLSPLSVNHAGPRRWKPMSNFIFQNTQRTGRRRKRKRSRRWMSLRLSSRESYWTCVTTPSLTTDPCSLLAVTVLTAFCAVYCKYPSFFCFEKERWFHVFAFSDRLDRRICWTLFCSKTFYRSHFTPHSCKWIPNFVFLSSYPSNLGSCRWVCRCIDGHEKSNGTYDRHLRWKLDCEYFLKQVHLNLTIRCVNSKSQLLLFLF